MGVGGRRPRAWDEELTGLLVLGLDRPDERGGPACFTSRLVAAEHWGRGFEAVLVRPAGVAMAHPDQGLGLAVWRRRDGAPMDASAFAAVPAGDVREGRAFRHQLALASAEARRRVARRSPAVAAAQERAVALGRPDAVEHHPRVRDAIAAVAALEADVEALRSRPVVRAQRSLRALRGRVSEALQEPA